MTNPRWNEGERKCYERLSKTGNGKDPEGVEGLAYKAVCEMYANRIDRENQDKFREGVMDALCEMSDGICLLEDRLGISVSEMAKERFAKRMRDERMKSLEICRVILELKSEGSERLGRYADRLAKAIGLDMKEVESNVEILGENRRD